jgi:hypothetical protein
MDPCTDIRRGMTVMSNDGVQMGYVIDVTTDGIIVQKGALTLKDLRVPFTDVSTVRGDEITLVKDHAAVMREGTEGGASFAAPPPGPQQVPQPHEPPMVERRAAGPGWDPLSVDEEWEKKAPRTSGPDTEPPTHYQARRS